ncbi:hypothetical protein FACS189494_11840 [Spirochaetia bacterium]|nr:hypothetical protein FACS189494_11840 [Spirochaetia bacterium]
MKRLLCGIFLCAALHCAFAGGSRDASSDTSGGDGKKIVASTSWVAAIARAAGAERITILAPSELKHPPEYELKPSDLRAASKADIILYASWEMFAKKLAETAGSAGVQIINVYTTNDPVKIKEEARRLASIFGTTEREAAWEKEFDTLTAKLRTEIQAAYPNKRAAVNRMQLPFATWAGFTVAGEYGPAEPSPAVIVDLVGLKPNLVIDNYHGPSGIPIAEAAKVPYSELINFPGKDGTVTLEDVFKYNAAVLIKAANDG